MARYGDPRGPRLPVLGAGRGCAAERSAALVAENSVIATDTAARQRQADATKAKAIIAQVYMEQAGMLQEHEDPRYDWESRCRPDQHEPPGAWRYWVVLAGRGYGKTRIGSEWVRKHATSGDYRFVNIIGATADDARDIMIEGESGLLAVSPERERPRYIASKRQLVWPNGCKTLIFTADEPERLRGKQHEKLWCDEVASWRRSESWIQAMLGLRLGPNPQALATTTPKPRAFLRKLIDNPHASVTTGTTYDNRANLAPEFFDEIIVEYEGTHLGRQELEGQLLAESAGALWHRVWLDKNRVLLPPETLHRVAVGVDPPGGVTECGIVAAGLGPLVTQPANGGEPSEDADHRFTLGDWSAKLSPGEWGREVIRVAIEVKADVIAAERNFGGDMVEHTIKTAAADPEFKGRSIPPVLLVTASRGKAVRAQPFSAMAEKGREHHVGKMDDLEDELCTWEPGEKSPNRLDAKVWALAALEQRIYRTFVGHL